MYKPVFQKREVIVFRQFQRKGWSLFACLGREVVISVLSVATLSATKAANISDEVWRADTAQTTKEVWLGDVGVTGSRAPLTQSQAARMVTVLSHDDIAQAPVQSVNDLLKYAVGVDVRQRGALGSQTDISIRGGTQEQIIILLNGINICDAQTGHNTVDLPCQLDDIVRVEVLEGPAGRAYGTSSLVGAVNIVTAQPRPKGTAHTQPLPNGGELYSEVGSFGYVKVGGITRLPTLGKGSGGDLGGSLSASYARSDGYSRSKAGRLNTDYSGSKTFYQGSYDDEHVRLWWHAGLSDKGWGSGTFYATPKWQADEQYEHTTKWMTAIQGETKHGRLRIHPALYWNQHRDRYEGYRNQPEVMKYNYNRCNVYGANLNVYFDWAAGRTAFGGELRNEDLVSANLGEPLFQPQHISGTDRDYTLGINRTNTSAHLEHNVLLDRLTLSAGFVAMKSSWSAANWHLYPGVDVSYLLLGSPSQASLSSIHPSPFTFHQLKFFASYNTSLRLPSFTEMYYKLQGYAADPHLKPEEMEALEAGLQYYSPALKAKASVWHHHGKNMIDWIMDSRQGDAAVWESVNHTKINATGVEASMGVDLRQLLSLNTQHSTLSISYSYITQDKELEEGVVSQYALEYLRHKLVAQLSTSLWRQLSLGLNFRWQDRTGLYTTFSGEVEYYRPFALLDARLQWTASHVTLYGEVNNLLDNQSYVDYGNVPQPGIWFIGGVKWRLPF